MAPALFDVRSRKQTLLGVVADSGLIARVARQEGADFLAVLSAGLFRNRGGISLAACFMPYLNGNDLVERQLSSEILPAAGGTPVLVGLLAGDPTCSIEERLDRLCAWQVAGVTNFPTVSMLDGSLRTMFAEEGWTIDEELRLLTLAKKKGLLALGFVGAEPETPARFAAAGLDALVLIVGPTRLIEDAYERRDRLQHTFRLLKAGLDEARQVDPLLPVLVIGGPIAHPEDLEQILRQGEFDGFLGGSVFARFPVERSVAATIRRFRGISVRRTSDPAGLRAREGMGAMIGDSEAMLRLYYLVERAASCDFNVLIEGESGVGKELVATQIHRLSSRASEPLITLNCGAIPDSLLESELFGHERGAFTGADYRRQGKFELAHRGTLFLDEIVDLSPHGQVALLRALQQREVVRVGGNLPIQVDNRILAASNRPLAAMVEQGKFRADLYYRLNQISLTVPPLRERFADLPKLVKPILESLCVQMKKDNLELAAEFFAKLRSHAWPGNLRELQHVIYQAAITEEGPVLLGDSFQPAVGTSTPASLASRPPTRRQRAQHALTQADGNKSRAAETLGITRKTLYNWLSEPDSIS